MPPPSVKREIYSYPRHRLIVRSGGRDISFERSFRVHSEIDSVCLFVCPTLRSSVCLYYDLQTIKRIADLSFYRKSSMLYINGIVSTSSTNKWESSFKLQIRFRIDGREPKIIQTNSEA